VHRRGEGGGAAGEGGNECSFLHRGGHCVKLEGERGARAYKNLWTQRGPKASEP